MSEYIHLVGTEEIRSAANTMASAAERMIDAHNWQSDLTTSHQRFMTEWLERFEQILKDHEARVSMREHGCREAGPR